MKIKIILEVDADELDWGDSGVYPSDNTDGWGDLDFDIDTVKWEGKTVEFVDTDQACDWLEFLWHEGDHKEYGNG